MSDDLEFIDYIRAGDWTGALALTRTGSVSASIATPGRSVYHWLIDLDAPAILIIALLSRGVRVDDVKADGLGLLEACLYDTMTRANRFETFSALLAFGLSPNVTADGGMTLLQRAMRLNRVREVRELLRFGVDAHQMSVFGLESASNLDEARDTDNEASRIVLAHFAESTRA